MNKVEKKAARKLSLERVKALRTAAEKASAAAKAEPSIEALKVAHAANHHASQAGSAHYFRFGGGILFHDKNEVYRTASLDFEWEASLAQAELNTFRNSQAAELAASPKWQAEKLSNEAAQHELAAFYCAHPHVYRPGVPAEQNAAQRVSHAAKAIEALEKAFTLVPLPEYEVRIAKLREKHPIPRNIPKESNHD